MSHPISATQFAYVMSVLHNLMDARWWRNQGIGMHVCKLSIGFYIITQVILAFWLVLTYDLLEDRRIDDVIIKTSALCFLKIQIWYCVILWTNNNSLLSTATNQFASFCIDNRSRQSAIFVSVKVAKFEIKRLFFRIF